MANKFSFNLFPIFHFAFFIFTSVTHKSGSPLFGELNIDPLSAFVTRPALTPFNTFPAKFFFDYLGWHHNFPAALFPSYGQKRFLMLM